MASQAEFNTRIGEDFPDNSKLRVYVFRDFFVDLVDLIYNQPGSSANDYEQFRQQVFGTLDDPELEEKLNSSSLLEFLLEGVKIKNINLPDGSSINDYITGLGTQDDLDKYFTVKPNEVVIFKFKVKQNGTNTFNGYETYIFKGGNGNFGIKGTYDDPDRIIKLVYADDFIRIDRELFITEQMQSIVMGNNTLAEYLSIMESNDFESILDALVKLKADTSPGGGGSFTIPQWLVYQPGNPNGSNGKVVNPGDSIELFLKDIFRKGSPPAVYNMPTASIGFNPSNTTFEIGTVINPLTIIGTFIQNDAGDFTAKRIWKNGSLLVSGDSTTDNIALIIDTTFSYSYQVDYGQGPIKNNSLGEPDPANRIQLGTVSSGTIIFKGTPKIFYGVSTPDLVNYRTLNWVWDAATTVTINTGTTLKDYYILVKVGRTVTSIKDVQSSNNELINQFTISDVMVKDAGNNDIPYKLWKWSPPSTYPTSHNLLITII